MKKILILVILASILTFGSSDMITIPYNDSNIQYLGRYLNTVGYKQTAWQGSQIRFKVKSTTKVIVTADISDSSASSLCFLGVSIDNEEDVTVYSLSTTEEIFTGERSVTINLPDTNEHLITIKTSSNMPLDQYATTSYIRFKNIQIDDTGEILPYPQSYRKIMCIGDSWMAAQNDWPRLMGDKYGIYPIAFGGAKASDLDSMYPYQSNSITKNSDGVVDGVIICLGVNDYAGGISTSDYKISINSLINKVRIDQPNAPIFLLQAPRNIGAGLNYDQYGAVLKELSTEKTNIIYISSEKIWNDLIWADDYHISSKQIFADFIANQLDLFYKDESLNFYLDGVVNSISFYDNSIFTLKITVNGKIKGLKLVDVNDVKASNIRIKTSEGIMAIAI